MTWLPELFDDTLIVAEKLPRPRVRMLIVPLLALNDRRLDEPPVLTDKPDG